MTVVVDALVVNCTRAHMRDREQGVTCPAL